MSNEAGSGKPEANLAQGGSTLTLHIGLPKTATTFLQTTIFQQIAGVKVLPTPVSGRFVMPDDLATGQRIMSCALKRSAAIWSQWGDTLFSDMLGPREAWSVQNVLISDEGIGRIGSRPELLNAHLRCIARQAERWGFSELRLVCLFRRQDFWLASHYAQISDRNHAASQADFERMARSTISAFQARYEFGMLLDYAALYDALVDVVGARGVAMIPYEQLSADSEAFYHRLSGFLGVAVLPQGPDANGANADRNVRSAGAQTWELRASSRGAGRLVHALLGRIRLHGLVRPRTITLTDELSREILDVYRHSNVRLARALSTDLAPYGY